eukprot:scaffold5391_cov73-Skeletonema_marinoi.AAC.1
MTIIDQCIRSIVGGCDDGNALSNNDLLMCMMILQAIAMMMYPAMMISSVSAFYSTATIHDSEFDREDILTEMAFTHEFVLSTFGICLLDAWIDLDDDGVNQCKCYIRFLKSQKKQRLINEDIQIDAAMNRIHDLQVIANLRRRMEDPQNDEEAMDDIHIIPADHP